MSGKDILSGLKHGEAIRFIHLFLHPVINWRGEVVGFSGWITVCVSVHVKGWQKKAAEGSVKIIHTYKVLHWL